jgi:hypothetical protein
MACDCGFVGIDSWLVEGWCVFNATRDSLQMRCLLVCCLKWLVKVTLGHLEVERLGFRLAQPHMQVNNLSLQ